VNKNCPRCFIKTYEVHQALRELGNEQTQAIT
jgi:hypothetical protein